MSEETDTIDMYAEAVNVYLANENHDDALYKYYSIENKTGESWEWWFHCPLGGGRRGNTEFETELECELSALAHWERVKAFIRCAL